MAGAAGGAPTLDAVLWAACDTRLARTGKRGLSAYAVRASGGISIRHDISALNRSDSIVANNHGSIHDHHIGSPTSLARFRHDVMAVRIPCVVNKRCFTDGHYCTATGVVVVNVQCATTVNVGSGSRFRAIALEYATRQVQF